MPLADVPAEALQTIEHNVLACEAYRYEHKGGDFIEFVDRLGREGEAVGKDKSNDRGAFDVVRKKAENGGELQRTFQGGRTLHAGQVTRTSAFAICQHGTWGRTS